MVNKFLGSDFGFLGSIIPIVLIWGISFALAKRKVDTLFIQFPITLGIYFIFPLFHVSFVFISLAIFIMSLLGTNTDILSDIKSLDLRSPLSRARDKAKDLDKEAVERALTDGLRQFR